MIEPEPREVVAVPSDDDMAKEPARRISQLTRIKNGIAMLVSVAGIVIAPELSEDLDLLIQSGVAVFYGIYAIYQAYNQGEQTREAVYAPASAARLARLEPTQVRVERRG